MMKTPDKRIIQAMEDIQMKVLMYRTDVLRDIYNQFVPRAQRLLRVNKVCTSPGRVSYL